MAKDAYCDLRNTAKRMKKYTIYYWIVDILAERDIKQAEMARSMDLDGPKLSRLLGGEREMRPDEAIKISRFLNMPVDWVLTGESPLIGDDELMAQSAKAILKEAKSRGVKLPLEQAMSFTIDLYNHIIKYRKRGENIVPSESLANFILDKLRA